MNTTQKGKVRLVDIARMAGVSRPTVSMALANHPEINPETRKRICLISRKLGYLRPGERNRHTEQKGEPSKSLRFGCLLVGRRLEDDTLVGLLHEMSLQASELNARLELKAIEDISNPKLVNDQFVAFVRELDGVIVQGLVNKTLLDLVDASHVPYIILGGVISRPGEPSQSMGHRIDFNVQEMGQAATECLLMRGHRRIGFFCEKVIRGTWNHRWLIGYQVAHLDAGITPESALIHTSADTLVGGRPAAEYFSSLQDPPTAYVCPAVRVAASFIAEMEERGIRIPQDALFTCGNCETALKYRLHNYPLIVPAAKDIGKAAIESLYQLYKNPASCPLYIQLPFAIQNLPPAECSKLSS